MNPIQNLISENMIQALGWTLIHTLWQGAVIALLLAITLIIFRKNSSKARYFISTSALTMLLVTAIFTFVSIYQPQQAKPINLAQSGKVVLGPNAELQIANQLQNTGEGFQLENYFSFFSQYFNQHLPLVVTLWLLGVLVLMLRFMGAFAYIQRLKHYRTKAVSDFWQTKVILLACQLNISKTIRLVESEIVKVPMAIGFLKPVILLPIGTLTGLSVQQVESILAHELAHIYRNDYLINLIQSLVEIVLFFNPAMWWISGRIREERENCCDDIAIALTKDNITFARTLATLEEMRHTSPELAVAFASRKGFILNRIKRLVNHKNVNSTFSEGFWTACVLLMLVFSVSYQANASLLFEEDKEKEYKEEVLVNPQSDVKEEDVQKEEVALLQLEDTIRFGKNFMLVTDKYGKVTVFKDGVLIPEEDYSKFEKEFAVSDNKIRIGDKDNQDSQITISTDKKKSMNGHSAYIYSTDRDHDHKGWHIVIPPIPPIPPIPNLPHLGRVLPYQNDNVIVWDDKDDIIELKINGKNIDLKDIDQYRSKIDKMRSKRKKGKNGYSYSFDFDVDSPEWKSYWENFGKQMEQYGEKVGKSMEGWSKEFEEKMKDFEFKMDDFKANSFKVGDDNMDRIIPEMVKDGLVKDQNHFSIAISKNKIVIEGKKLEGELYEKYKKILKDELDLDIEKTDSNWNWNYVNEED